MSGADTPNTKLPNLSAAASPVEVVAPSTSPVAAAATSTNAKNVAVVNNKHANANTGSGHIATLLETGEKLSLGELTIVEDGGMKYGVLPLSEETVSELRNKYGSSSPNGATSSPNGASPAKGGSRKRKANANAKKSRKTRSKK
jgi:hypothetical protein